MSSGPVLWLRCSVRYLPAEKVVLQRIAVCSRAKTGGSGTGCSPGGSRLPAFQHFFDIETGIGFRTRCDGFRCSCCYNCTAPVTAFRSKINISASLPRANVPFRSSIPIRRAGVSEAIRIASANGISAFCTIVRTRSSIVARLQANEE